MMLDLTHRREKTRRLSLVTFNSFLSKKSVGVKFRWKCKPVSLFYLVGQHYGISFLPIKLNYYQTTKF